MEKCYTTNQHTDRNPRKWSKKRASLNMILTEQRNKVITAQEGK